MTRKRILSIALSFALVFTTVFAGVGSTFAGTYGTETVTGGAVAQQLATGAPEAAPLVPTVMEYSNTAKPGYVPYSTVAGGLISIIPVPVTTTGWMYLDAVAAAENDYGAKVFLVDQYSYDAATGMISVAQDKVNDYWYLSPGETVDNLEKMYVKAGKTYYILFQSADYSAVNPMANFRATIYTTGERMVNASTSKWTVASSMNAAGETGKATYFKVKPTKTGTMRVFLKEYGCDSSYGYVTLYNAKKKALSEKVRFSSSNSPVYFGVKKNTTYYLKVEGCYGSYSENYKYGVRYTMTAGTDKAFTKKAKAKLLKRKGDAVTNLFTASTTTATDWYKFNVTAKRKTQIKVNTTWIKSGFVTVTVYKGSKKIDSVKIYGGNNGGTYELTHGTTYGKADKGIYYVKVVKSAKASGKYSVKYVK